MEHSTAVSILANDLPASWVNIPKCLRCHRNFIKTKTENKQPILLACLHAYCTSCIAYISKKDKSKCEVCSTRIKFNKSMKWNYQYDYDYYLLGFMTYKTYILPQILKPSTISEFLGSEAIRKLSESSETKCIECSMSTQYMCVQCSSPYCKSCFNKVHANGAVIKTHEFALLNSSHTTIGRVLTSCKYHTNAILDHVCRTCSCPICSVCVMQYHRKHDTEKLLSSNEKVELDETLNLLLTVEQQIREAQKNAILCINKIDEHASSAAQEIFEYFRYYHAILQSLEKEALMELKERAIHSYQKVYDVKAYLDKSENQIETVISRLTSFLKDTPDNVNLATIHNEVLTFLEKLPTEFNEAQFSKNPFGFSGMDLNKNNDLKETCKVVFKNKDFTPKLNTFLSVSKSYDEPMLLPPDEKSYMDYRPKKTGRLLSSPTVSSIVKPHQSSESLTSKRIKTRKVIVTEIKSPSLYCVQSVEFLRFKDRFIEECNQCALNTVNVTKIVIGEMVLVYESFDLTKWYRGIVQEKFPTSVVVFLLDFGRTLVVMEKQLRKISPYLRNLPRSANEFSILNVKPKDGEWSAECVALIREMALNNRMTLISSIDDETCGDLIAELDYPTSVKDMLLYFDYGELAVETNETVAERQYDINKKKDALIQTELQNTKKFTKQVIKKDETFDARVVNIVSPKELHITKVSHAREVETLCEEINHFYEQGSHRKIYYPHSNVVCCAYTCGRWNRARIIRRHSNLTVDVYLVDIGEVCQVEWRYLRMLEDKFLNLPEGVSKCSLADIAPKNRKGIFDPKATVELKRLCKNELRVFVCDENAHSIDIELFIIRKKKNFLINAWLAQHDFVEWIGETAMTLEHLNETFDHLEIESPICETKVIASQSQPSQKELRQMVKIVNIISPSELYVTLIKFQSGIELMHSQIQKTMADKVCKTQSKIWKVGDNCLISSLILKNAKKYWYRARIHSVENKNCTVLLRDHGIILSALLMDLAEIDHYYDSVIDGATKCHLGNLKPTSKEWAKSSIDELKYMTEAGNKYDGFAVSVHGEMEDGSLPIYLWGQRKSLEDPLAGASISWKNINEKFALSGFADYITAFKTIVDCDLFDNQFKQNEMTDFNTWSQKFTTSKFEQGTDIQKQMPNEDDFILEAELDPNHEVFCREKVTEWPPPRPLLKYVFTAIPTYVDNNATIHLHASSQEQYLQRIKFSINKHVKSIKYDLSYKWRLNEACLVRFHSDNCFYRGIIRDVLPNNEYKVEFVDYGNIEICEPSDLREANILGNVPIQATKYYLAFLRPLNKDRIWNKKILELIHVTVVSKLVSVRVEDNVGDEFIPCSITVGPVCVNKMLVVEKLAEHTPDINVRLSLPDTHDFYAKDNSTENRDKDKYKESISLEEFQQKMALKHKAQKEKDYLDQFNFNVSADLIVEDDSDSDDNLNARPRGNIVQSDFDDFEPIDTSSVKSKAEQSTAKSLCLLPFKQIILGKYITKFPCKVFGIINSTQAVVEPIIEQHTKLLSEMEKKINRSHRSDEKFNFTDERACLARYSNDGLYYRAVIKKHNHNKTKVLVKFVDYLNEEIVERKYIRPCPIDILQQPLKHMIVTLHGVSPSARIREADIKRELDNLIDNDAVAIVAENGPIPSVHLFYKENQDVLIYQSIIDMKFLTQTKC